MEIETANNLKKNNQYKAAGSYECTQRMSKIKGPLTLCFIHKKHGSCLCLTVQTSHSGDINSIV